MCDHGSDYISLSDIPEFPGYYQLEHENEVSAFGGEGAESYSSGSESSETDSSDEDYGVLISHPQTGDQRDSYLINSADHHLPNTSQHVTNFVRSPEPPQNLGPTSDSPSKLNRSEYDSREERKGERQRRLLEEIKSNPARRRERAEAIYQLQEAAAKLKLGSREEDSYIFELAILAQALASKTEKTAVELFIEYKGIADKRRARGLDQDRNIHTGILPPLDLGHNIEPETKVEPLRPTSVTNGRRAVKVKVRDHTRLKKLRVAVSRGKQVPESQIVAVRRRLTKAARDLGKDPLTYFTDLNNYLDQVTNLPTKGVQRGPFHAKVRNLLFPAQASRLRL
jgi:hypothetical protein